MSRITINAISERVTSLESTYKANSKHVTDALARIEGKLDKQNDKLWKHEQRITRLDTKIKLLMGGVGGSGAVAGIIYGIINGVS